MCLSDDAKAQAFPKEILAVSATTKYGWALSGALALTVAAVYVLLRASIGWEKNWAGFGVGLAVAAVAMAIYAILSLEPDDRSRRVWEPVILVPLFGIVSFLMLIQIAGSDWGPRKSQCISNIKRLSVAALMYRADNDGYMPLGNRWGSDIGGYLKSSEHGQNNVYKCPWGDQPYSYGLNGQLAGMAEKEFGVAETLVMVFEGTSESPNHVGGPKDFVARHEGKGSIGFADGHAKSFRPGDPKMRWRP